MRRGYKIVGKNSKTAKEKTIKKMKKDMEKSMKYIKKEGTIPRMKGLPKIYKKEIGMRPVVNCRGTVLGNLEEEMAKVVTVIGKRRESGKEWREMVLEDEDIMFSLAVEKMFTNIKREGLEKELTRLIGCEEVITGWKKEEVLENLIYIWDNTYWIIEGKIVSKNR